MRPTAKEDDRVFETTGLYFCVYIGLFFLNLICRAYTSGIQLAYRGTPAAVYADYLGLCFLGIPLSDWLVLCAYVFLFTASYMKRLQSAISRISVVTSSDVATTVSDPEAALSLSDYNTAPGSPDFGPRAPGALPLSIPSVSVSSDSSVSYFSATPHASWSPPPSPIRPLSLRRINSWRARGERQPQVDPLTSVAKRESVFRRWGHNMAAVLFDKYWRVKAARADKCRDVVPFDSSATPPGSIYKGGIPLMRWRRRSSDDNLNLSAADADAVSTSSDSSDSSGGSMLCLYCPSPDSQRPDASSTGADDEDDILDDRSDTFGTLGPVLKKPGSFYMGCMGVPGTPDSTATPALSPTDTRAMSTPNTCDSNDEIPPYRPAEPRTTPDRVAPVLGWVSLVLEHWVAMAPEEQQAARPQQHGIIIDDEAAELAANDRDANATNANPRRESRRRRWSLVNIIKRMSKSDLSGHSDDRDKINTAAVVKAVKPKVLEGIKGVKAKFGKVGMLIRRKSSA